MPEEGPLTRFASRSWVQVVAVAVVGLALAKCSGQTELVVDGPEATSGDATGGDFGTAGFQLDVGSGIVVNTVTSTLTLPDGTTHTQNFDVSTSDAAISVYLGELAVGSGYQISLSASATNGADCAGKSSFKVKKNETVVVSVKMQCTGGIADPDVGAAKIKGELIPATGECPPVIDRIEAAPSRVGLNIPVSVEVFPVDGTPPIVTFSATGGTLTANATQPTRTTFTCRAEGGFDVTAEVTRAGCVQHATASIKCVDDGGGAGGSSGAGGAGGAGDTGGAGGSGAVAGAAGTGQGGSGDVAGAGGGGASTACTTCTASNCPAQLTSCQSDPTSAGCQENRTCADVGTGSSCATASSFDCYCGVLPLATCLEFGGTGPCAEVIARTSGCNDGRAPDAVALCVSQRFLDANTGLGDAYQLVACQRRNCSVQCALSP
jgi:hypothetical protein